MPLSSRAYYIFAQKGIIVGESSANDALDIAPPQTLSGFQELEYAELHFSQQPPQNIINIREISFSRVMDRFFIQTPHDEKLTKFLFTLIADYYDDAIDGARNANCWAALFEAGTEELGHPPRSCLDFGCGTGGGLTVWRAKDLSTNNSLVGTDLCSRMLGKAKERGMNVIPFPIWERRIKPAYDLVLACYVMHYGVSAEHVQTIASQLADGGLFCANFFKMPLGAIEDTISPAQLELVRWIKNPIHGPIGIFRNYIIGTARAR